VRPAEQNSPHATQTVYEKKPRRQAQQNVHSLARRSRKGHVHAKNPPAYNEEEGMCI